MSIQTELTRLTNAKAAIKAAIEGKGVTVPGGTLLDGMASLIEGIEAGGGISFSDFKYNFTKAYSGSVTYASTTSVSSFDISAPGFKAGTGPTKAVLAILLTDDATIDTSKTTLAFAMQFISSLEKNNLSSPSSLIRCGVEASISSSGSYSSGMAGAIYDEDRNTQELAYYTNCIIKIEASVRDDKLSFSINRYNNNSVRLCGGKSYHYLVLLE